MSIKSTLEDFNFYVLTNSDCKKCKYYVEEVTQLCNPFCMTCNRIDVHKTDRFEEKK